MSDDIIGFCMTCRYWEEDKKITIGKMREGLCRRYAPKVMGGWARTHGSDWCGDFGSDKEKAKREGFGPE